MLEHLVMSDQLNGKFSIPDIIPTEKGILLYVPLSVNSLFHQKLRNKIKSYTDSSCCHNP